MAWLRKHFGEGFNSTSFISNTNNINNKKTSVSMKNTLNPLFQGLKIIPNEAIIAAFQNVSDATGTLGIIPGNTKSTHPNTNTNTNAYWYLYQY